MRAASRDARGASLIRAANPDRVSSTLSEEEIAPHASIFYTFHPSADFAVDSIATSVAADIFGYPVHSPFLPVQPRVSRPQGLPRFERSSPAAVQALEYWSLDDGLPDLAIF